MMAALKQTVGDIEIASLPITEEQYQLLRLCADEVGGPLPLDPNCRYETIEDAMALVSAGALVLEDPTEEFPIIQHLNQKVDLLAHLVNLRVASTFGDHRLRVRDDDDDTIELVSSETYSRYNWRGVAEDLDRRDAAYLAFLHNSGPVIIETLLAENARLRAALAQTPDLAAYRAATRIIFEPECFYPEFQKNAPEDDTAEAILARAEAIGIKAHLFACEPPEHPCILLAARIAQATCPVAPHADLVGGWPLENGDYVLLFTEPLTPAGAA